MTWWAFQKHFWGGTRLGEERTGRLLHWSGGEIMEVTHVVGASPGRLPSPTALLEIAAVPLPRHLPTPAPLLLPCLAHFLIIPCPLLIKVVIY